MQPYDRAKMTNAAQRYAKANPSNPFALSRAQTHIANGIACLFDDDGRKCYYDADEVIETRTLPDGSEYQVTAYRNIIRP